MRMCAYIYIYTHMYSSQAPCRKVPCSAPGCLAPFPVSSAG